MSMQRSHTVKASRRWLLWLGGVCFGVLVFLASFGSLFVEHSLQKLFRSAVATMPVSGHGMPEIAFFPPGITLDRLVLKGPQDELTVRDIRLDVKLLDSALAIRGRAAGGRFEADLHAEGWGKGVCKLRWKMEGVNLTEVLKVWTVLEKPIAVLDGRVTMEGQYSVPSRKELSRPWTGTGRVQCSLSNASIRHILPVLTKMELDGIEGMFSADWNKRRITLREANLRQKDISLELQGGLNLMPSAWSRTPLQLEAKVKAEKGVLNEKLLPERLRLQHANGGLQVRLSGTPEKPKVEF